MLCLEGVGGGCGVRRLNTLGRSEAELWSGSLRKSLVAGSSAGGGGCACRGPPCARLPKSQQPRFAQLCCGVWYSQHPTTSAGSSPAGWETWRDPSPLPRSTRNSGLCLAVGCRRCSGMASCFNSSGPAQTYVMGRVWACSHTLLAGVPFPLDPLQFAFAAGIG